MPLLPSTGIRYVQGSEDFVSPPISIVDEYWLDPQQDIERYAVTVPLPWSWEPADSITASLMVEGEDGDLTRPIPWKKWVTPQPWTFDGLYRATTPAAIAHGPLGIQLALSHLDVLLTPSVGVVSLSPSILHFPLSSNEE